MTEGDRPAVDVQPLLLDPELARAGEHLGGERLVDLDQVDVVKRQSGAVQCSPDRGHRAHPHVGGIDAGDADRHDARQRPGAELLRALAGGQHQAGGAVVER